tara:strand:+ start:4555 stop:4872 length:318 start_codon:yes stop_codon:yes gene_type:complete
MAKKSKASNTGRRRKAAKSARRKARKTKARSSGIGSRVLSRIRYTGKKIKPESPVGNIVGSQRPSRFLNTLRSTRRLLGKCRGPSCPRRTRTVRQYSPVEFTLSI